jgi:chitinase domain-containing protein 1
MEAVDYLNIMTYDFSGTDAEGDSPIQWIINNAQAFIISSRELSTKIVIGLNYYGRCKGSINDVILGNRFLELLNNPEYKLFWDDITHEHYLKSYAIFVFTINRIHFSESTKCFYPTLRSIEDRLDLVEEMRLGGVGIWELGQGLNHFTSVL